MDNLAVLANVAEIVGMMIVIIGLIFAVLQMRQIRQQRRELAAIELFRFLGSPHFTSAFTRILRMPEDLSMTDMRREKSSLEDAAMLIGSTMENVGVMTYQRIVPFTVVNHLIGANAIILWHKLRPWIEALRKETNNDFIFEWFQWLVIQLNEYDDENERPAYEAYGAWKPRHLLKEE